jgi:glycosyltransferase involved in cell wall biosynthesis
MSSLVVYDANYENPTGAELAAILARQGEQVVWLLPHGAAKIRLAAPTVDARAVLAGRAVGRPLARRLRQIVGPLLLLGYASRGRRILAIWIHDPWDGLILSVLSWLVPNRVFFIHNNPRALRPRAGIAAKFEDFVVRRAHVIVHTDATAEAALAETDHVHVVAHPNYSMAASVAPARRPADRRIAFVGGLRADKGADLLPELLLGTRGDFEFRTIGRGRLPEADITRLSERAISYVATGELDDPGFFDELAEVTVVVAPYVQPTESGSVLMCMALGVPVLALESPAMRRVLNDASLAAGIPELAAMLDRFLDRPWNTYRLTPEQQSESSSAHLREALRCQRLSRS